ncbi:hypothetical protein C8F04DRAFT_1150534 [Mycena alexandri]|uniref:F-box domain-containing protein n=1 Tax=Mycena alexandri TaxID=1745969 RepID=A0AAD6WN01_9AGAR|nr:hypothetical protein C8F04DRAFT_1150534 [Mycena alexandri]
MRALSALPLDDDIVDRILTFCPSFKSLQCMILVSKTFHRIFQTRPKSILRAVAYNHYYNIVGPAFPQALRAARYPYWNPDRTQRQHEKDDPEEMATAYAEDPGPSGFYITAEDTEESRWLVKNAGMVQTLENAYSLTQKDHTSKTSVLSPQESFRFQRAVYRICLYTHIFSGDRYSLEEIEDMSTATINHIWRQRTAVLAQYPTEELFQIHAVIQFFRGIFEGICEFDSERNLIDLFLSTGPGGVERAWEFRSLEAVDDWLGFSMNEGEVTPLYEGYISRPLQVIWVQRGAPEPRSGVGAATRSILDTIVGENDTCFQCAASGGLKLLTQANWSRLSIVPPALLKNRLKENKTETRLFRAAVEQLRPKDEEDDSNELGHGGDTPASELMRMLRWAAGANTNLLGGGDSDDEHSDVESDGEDSDRDLGGTFVFGSVPSGIDDDFTKATYKEKQATEAFIAAVFERVANRKPDAAASAGAGGWDDWTSDKSYCRPCLMKFLEEHVWQWWLDERVGGRHPKTAGALLPFSFVCCTKFLSESSTPSLSFLIGLPVVFTSLFTVTLGIFDHDLTSAVGMVTIARRWCTRKNMRRIRIISASPSRVIPDGVKNAVQGTENRQAKHKRSRLGELENAYSIGCSPH